MTGLLSIANPSDPFSATDGSLGAPVGGSFQQPNFYTSYAPQNGQSYTATPAWKMPGIDYPVGFPASSLPLTDPTSGWSPPSGASYASNLITVSGANATLDGLDFSKAGGVCVLVTSAATGTVTIKNSKVVFGAQTENVSINNGMWLQIAAGCNANLVIETCDVDGQAIQGNTADFMKNFGNGTVLRQYNRIYNVMGRFFYGAGAFLAQYEYYEGQNYNSAAHGEWSIFNAMPSSGLTLPSIRFSFCTLLEPATFGGGMTAPIYASSGATANNLTITAVQVDHCVSVINAFQFNGYIVGTQLTITACDNQQLFSGLHLQGAGIASGTQLGTQVSGTTGGVGVWNVNNSQTFASSGSPGTIQAITVSVALLEVGYDTIGTVSLTNCYVDPTGSFGAAYSNTGTANSPTLTETGNVNMITGGAIT